MQMFQSYIQSVATYFREASRSTLAIIVFGAVCVVTSIAVVGAYKTGGHNDSNYPQGNRTLQNGVAGTSAGTSSTTTSEDKKSDEDKKKDETATPNSNTPGATTGSNAGNTAKPANSGGTASNPVSRATYNLNETWYLVTASNDGLFNTCWPVMFTEENEDACADPSNPLSHISFTGLGIARSAEAAGNAAADQAYQKAIAQHVEPKKGGADDALILNESLCAQYGLSCGRY